MNEETSLAINLQDVSLVAPHFVNFFVLTTVVVTECLLSVHHAGRFLALYEITYKKMKT